MEMEIMKCEGEKKDKETYQHHRECVQLHTRSISDLGAIVEVMISVVEREEEHIPDDEDPENISTRSVLHLHSLIQLQQEGQQQD